MTAKTKTALKDAFFVASDAPTRQKFEDLIDSLYQSVANVGAGPAQSTRKLIWSNVDANSRDWNENMATWTNTGGGNNNNTWQWGYNNAPTGGGVDATEHSWYIQMESRYNPTATAHVPTAEYHLNHYAAGASSPLRPFQFNVAVDDSWAETFFTFDKIHFLSRTDAHEQGALNSATGVLSLNDGGIQILKNNVGAIRQYNAAADTVLNIAYVSGANYVVLGDANTPLVQVQAPELWVNGNFSHHGTTLGFYNATKVAKQTGVAVTAAAIHAALVNLGLIAA